MRGFILALVASVFVPLATLSAQEPPPLEPGARVQITHACQPRGRSGVDCRKDRGSLVTANADSIVLAIDGQTTPLAVPRAFVEHLEISSGKKSRVGSGALIGGLVGVGVGAAAGGVLAGFCELDGGTGQSASECRPAAMAGGGLVGGLLGALIGVGIGEAAGPSDRWEEVPLDRLRVSFAPQRDGITLGVTLRF